MDVRFANLRLMLARDALRLREQLPDLARTRLHKFMCGATRDLHAPLRGAYKPVQIFSGVIGLQSVEQLPTGQEQVGVELEMQIISHRDKRVGAAPTALYFQLRLRCRTTLLHLARRCAARRRSCRAALSPPILRPRSTRCPPRPPASARCALRILANAGPDRDRHEARRCAHDTVSTRPSVSSRSHGVSGL